MLSTNAYVKPKWTKFKKTGRFVLKYLNFENCKAYGLAFFVAFACVLFQSLEWVDALRLDRNIYPENGWWRLLSANFVHLGWQHLGMNLAGLAAIALLVWRYFNNWEWGVIILASCLFVGIGVILWNDEIRWYVGLSGALHGILMAGIFRELTVLRGAGSALLLLTVGKLAWEQFYGPLPGSETTAGGRVLVDAHLYGAVGGGVAAVFLLLRRWRCQQLAMVL